MRDQQHKMFRFGQPKYIEKILKHFSMETCKHMSTPLEVDVSCRN
jgi:hypothetical protein